MKIDLYKRETLIAIREEANKCANTEHTNTDWIRAFVQLAIAADHLDAMLARCGGRTTPFIPVK